MYYVKTCIHGCEQEHGECHDLRSEGPQYGRLEFFETFQPYQYEEPREAEDNIVPEVIIGLSDRRRVSRRRRYRNRRRVNNRKRVRGMFYTETCVHGNDEEHQGCQCPRSKGSRYGRLQLSEPFQPEGTITAQEIKEADRLLSLRDRLRVHGLYYKEACYCGRFSQHSGCDQYISTDPRPSFGRLLNCNSIQPLQLEECKECVECRTRSDSENLSTLDALSLPELLDIEEELKILEGLDDSQAVGIIKELDVIDWLAELKDPEVPEKHEAPEELVPFVDYDALDDYESSEDEETSEDDEMLEDGEILEDDEVMKDHEASQEYGPQEVLEALERFIRGSQAAFGVRRA